MRNLIILGSGRSGTSLAAGCFAGSGYFMGENLYEARDSNPKGFFESPQINAINELLIDTIPEDLFTFRPVFHHRWTAAIASPIHFPENGQPIAEIREAVRRQPFCFKDPRFSYTLPVWRPYLSGAGFVCVFREPANTALSLVKEVDDVRRTSGIPTRITYPQALRTWTAMYGSILAMDRTGEDWLFIHYNQILDGSAFEAMERLAGTSVDRRFPEERLSRSISAAVCDDPAVENLYAQLCELAGYRPHKAALRGAAGLAAQQGRRNPSISAVVLSRNGAGRIERCLESIAAAGVADEIVVCVDRSTTDNTAELARRFTNDVHFLETPGYIEPSLSNMAALCAGDWVLRLDDDETLGGDWGDGLLHTLVRFNDISHFWTPRRWLVPPGDRFIAQEPWFPGLQLRLFRNAPDSIIWPAAIHVPMIVKGRGLTLMDRWIDHHCLIIGSRAEREEKCRTYMRLRPEKHRSEVYLWEDQVVETLPVDAAGYRLAVERAAQARMAAAARMGAAPVRVAPAAAMPAAPYELGSEIRFDETGDSTQYRLTGWSHSEPWGTWTEGDRAVLRIPLARPHSGPMLVTIEAGGYVRPNHPILEVHVAFGSSAIAAWRIDTAAVQKRTIELACCKPAPRDVLMLEFHIANPASPSHLGESDDERILGLGFRTMRIDPA